MRVKSVAVIGAGVSGVAAAKHLQSAGLEVTVYERSSTIGGIWSYDERRPLEPSYPSTQPSRADFVPAEEGNGGEDAHVRVHGAQVVSETELQHAPPGPGYEGLTNNIPTYLLELKGCPWKEGTQEYVNHRVVLEYIHNFARVNDVERRVKFNTRVEKVTKRGDKWQLRASTWAREGADAGRLTYRTDEFDAVVVASGHYHAAKVPNLPGLKRWKLAWPDRISHSKAYRTPKEFQDQNLLLVGAGVSSTDIANEASPFAKKIYQVARSSPYDIPARFLPPNAERICAIASFSSPPLQPDGQNSQTVTPGNGEPIPAVVRLVDGRILYSIHRVILCTGYHISYPFLGDLHSDDTPLEDADDRVLVTDGTQIHNLHKHVFYIPDPTLAFVGTAYSVASFSLFEFQAIAVAAVFSGRANLPPEEDMRAEYRQRVAEKGLGRVFHMLKDEEIGYVNSIVRWVNQDGMALGVGPIEGHSEEWITKSAERREWVKKVFAKQPVPESVSTCLRVPVAM